MLMCTDTPGLVHAERATPQQLTAFEKCRTEKGNKFLYAEMQESELSMIYFTKSGYVANCFIDRTGESQLTKFYAAYNSELKQPVGFLFTRKGK